MNIFASSPDPALCAQALDDRRMNKMVLETAQLLSGALRLSWPRYVTESTYRLTHQNHPCAVWTRESLENYGWLQEHFVALCDEYTLRFAKAHACSQLEELHSPVRRRRLGIPSLSPNCTPHKNMRLFAAYKLTLNEKWAGETPRWTNRKPPKWRAA